MLFPNLTDAPFRFASFHKLPQNTKLAASTAILVISPLTDQQSGANLEAIISKIEEKNFKQIFVLITDELKVSMLKMDASLDGRSEEALLSQARQIGDTWLNAPENKRALEFIKESSRYTILRWHEISFSASVISLGGTKNLLDVFRASYDEPDVSTTNPNQFRIAVDRDAVEILDRFKKDGKVTVPTEVAQALEVTYLLTEYAGVLALAANNNASFLIYPRKMPLLILERLREKYLSGKDRSLLQWAGYKLSSDKKQNTELDNIDSLSQSFGSSSSGSNSRRDSTASDNGKPLARQSVINELSIRPSITFRPNQEDTSSDSSSTEEGGVDMNNNTELALTKLNTTLLQLTRASLKSDVPALAVLQMLDKFILLYQVLLSYLTCQQSKDIKEYTQYQQEFWTAFLEILTQVQEKAPTVITNAPVWFQGMLELAKARTTQQTGASIVVSQDASGLLLTMQRTKEKLSDAEMQVLGPVSSDVRETKLSLENTAFEVSPLVLFTAFNSNLRSYAQRVKDMELTVKPK